MQKLRWYYNVREAPVTIMRSIAGYVRVSGCACVCVCPCVCVGGRGYSDSTDFVWHLGSIWFSWQSPVRFVFPVCVRWFLGCLSQVFSIFYTEFRSGFVVSRY